MDDADRAFPKTEAEIEMARDAARQAAGDIRPDPAGYCLNGCGARPADGRRWCSPECRDDWQERETRLAENRRAGR